MESRSDETEQIRFSAESLRLINSPYSSSFTGHGDDLGSRLTRLLRPSRPPGEFTRVFPLAGEGVCLGINPHRGTWRVKGS